jgi:hypothetical protein
MKSFFKHFVSLFSIIVLFSVTGKAINGKSSASDKDLHPSKKDSTIVLNKNFHAILLFDPSGFITFGPAIYLEPAIGRRLSILGGLRVPNLGLVTYLYSGDLHMAVTAHLSLRYFVKPKQKIDGFFLGPMIEYGRSRIGTGSDLNIRAFGGEIGYKFLSKKKLSLEVSDNIGLIQSQGVRDRSIPVSGVPASPWKNEMFIFYMLSFKMGIKF